jgi:hypothetical protein
VQKLDLTNAIHVGHSTGREEVARYIAPHGTKRMLACPGKEVQSTQRRETMVKKPRMALVAAVTALSFASPAFSQSFDPDLGTGNLRNASLRFAQSYDPDLGTGNLIARYLPAPARNSQVSVHRAGL